MVDIEPCPCGARADTEIELKGGHYVSCSVSGCWIGPTRELKAEAIAAWNRIAGQRWRPIETAPRDGISVFLWWPYWSGHPVIGHCLSSGQWQSCAALSSEGDEPGPTHWRPALEPPEGDTP